ncbi:PTS system mannitol-specific EIICBA component [Nocardioides dokdonensis FR1436]|uniref:Mannitol-specific phosphotransferase enzyme IIA component n=1 Tax=Nocardioides dokdonensis FR1436 TaxID=1300347 RepID=A0A1A9GS41_9ACTN|nr:PTS mannitol transporter subunit IICBA [Nocardioides dokdonensis]ANH40463.1 PTS system mannitol-specific EIICBA component [Nocardioides dokdonensis FR1436]
MATTQATPGGARVQVQKVGTFLSNMVMPNIGAFIAWGLITALFIEKGWLNRGGSGGLAPDSWVAEIGGWGDFADGGIVGPMITYLLPLLIGYTGGKMMYAASPMRGGVVGAIATMGVIAGTDIPMFMGAMIMGPLGGWSMRHIDALWDTKIKPGFEMLVNNFAAGIWGAVLATFGFFVMSPIVTWIANRLEDGIDVLVTNNLLPFTSIIIEPAKVLFLNNALNHGVLTPLGSTEALENGKSVLFLLEANPGAGLGLLLAYSMFGKGLAKASAPGAAIIHFFGGIHEIYFPFVLMKPKLILAMIAGGMTQIFINVIFNSGLRAPAAPGSIIAVYAQTPSNSFIGVTLSVIGGAAATFVVAALLLKTDRSDDPEDQLVAATASMEAMKGKSSSVSGALLDGGRGTADHQGAIRSIVFACDAGMGSSAMGASVLRKKVHSAGFTDVTVVNQAISNLTDTYDLVVTHQDLTDRARQQTGSALHVSVDDFMSSPRYDEIVELLARTNADPAAAPSAAAAEPGPPTGLLARESIVLDALAESRDDAITRAGDLLVSAGAVDASYVAAMLDRETSVSTYMGNGLAIPHGTNEAKPSIRRSAISFVRYTDPLDWNGKPARFVIGIAGAGDDHLTLLRRIAEVFVDADQVARLEAAQSAAQVLEVLDVVQPA